MEISTDIPNIVRSVLSAHFTVFENTLPAKDGYEATQFLVKYPYDPRVRSEFVYHIQAETFADGAKYLRFMAENTHFHEPEKRAFLIEMAQTYHLQCPFPKVVVGEGDGVLKTYTEVNHVVRAGITPAIFESWMKQFFASNFRYLCWLEETDHGHRIPSKGEESG
ncbi:MAG: hypothetical protein ACKO5K_07725 [Armatimonadota bacterium]